MPLGVHSKGRIFRFFTCHHFFSSQLFQNTFPYEPFSKGFLRDIFPRFCPKKWLRRLKKRLRLFKRGNLWPYFLLSASFQPIFPKKGGTGRSGIDWSSFPEDIGRSKKSAARQRIFCRAAEEILLHDKTDFATGKTGRVGGKIPFLGPPKENFRQLSTSFSSCFRSFWNFFINISERLFFAHVCILYFNQRSQTFPSSKTKSQEAKRNLKFAYKKEVFRKKAFLFGKFVVI